MKYTFISLLFLLFTTTVISQTISPAEDSERCPDLGYPNGAGYFYTITFPDTAKFYSLSNFKHCKIDWYTNEISKKPFEATVYIQFEDQSAEKTTIQIFKLGSSSPVKTLDFTHIKSIADRTIENNLPILNASNCSKNYLFLIFTQMRFRTTGSRDIFDDYGAYLPVYEYQLPKGWKITSGYLEPSTIPGLVWGSNNIVLETSLLGINEVVKVRVVNAHCGEPYKRSQWKTIPIIRPALKPVINGSNSVTINCGDISTRTVSITNATGLTCATYEWNLIGRNWSDTNGNPITTIITTTEPKLNIKPTFNGTEPKNIVVKIKAGTEELVDSVLVVNTNITPTISGDGVICSSATYNIATTSTINWSVSPSGIVNLSTIGNQATLTRIGTSNNQIKLTGTFIKCGSTTPITINKDIYIGAPAITTDYKPNYNYLNVDLIGDKGINIDIQGITSTLWERISSTNGGTFGGSGFSGFGHGPNYIWTVTCKIDATNQCGTTTIERLFCVPAPLPCDDKPILQKKATNIYSKVTLPCLTKNKEITAYKSAVLFDYQGNIIKQFNSGYDIDVNGIKPGIYILQMDLGKEKVVDKIIVE